MSDTITSRLKNFGKKIAAVAFIVLILIGNLWLIYRFTGGTFPQWSVMVFGAAVAAAFAGGVLMIPAAIWPPEIKDETDDISDNDKI
jgi:hypothetical protein